MTNFQAERRAYCDCGFIGATRAADQTRKTINAKMPTAKMAASVSILANIGAASRAKDSRFCATQDKTIITIIITEDLAEAILLKAST